LEEILHKRRWKNIEFIKAISRLETFQGHVVKCDDLSYKNAKQLKAFRAHRCRANVEQFYFVRHKITLKYPNLPCIIVRGGKGHPYFYPLETIFLPDYELYEIFDCINLNADYQ
jgi:hypothetical protein